MFLYINQMDLESFNHTLLYKFFFPLMKSVISMFVTHLVSEDNVALVTVLHSSAGQRIYRPDDTAGYCTVIFFSFALCYSQMILAGDSFSLPQPSFHTNPAYFIFLRDEV